MTEAHHPEARGGGLVWGMVLAEAVAWDYIALRTGRETLSNATRRLAEIHPVLAIGLGSYAVLHLTGRIRKEFDPLDLVTEHVVSHL